MINLVTKAMAEMEDYKNFFPGGSTITSGATFFQEFFRFATNIFAPIVGGLVMLYGTFLYMKSAGDASKAKEGRDLIIGVIVGYLILLFSNLIISSLNV